MFGSDMNDPSSYVSQFDARYDRDAVALFGRVWPGFRSLPKEELPDKAFLVEISHGQCEY